VGELPPKRVLSTISRISRAKGRWKLIKRLQFQTGPDTSIRKSIHVGFELCICRRTLSVENQTLCQLGADYLMRLNAQSVISVTFVGELRPTGEKPVCPQSGQMVSATWPRISRLLSADKGSARKESRASLMSCTPGPGQSLPKSVLWAISSRRGKYCSRCTGGMLLMSKYTLAWRRTRKKAVLIQRGRPPWASTIFKC